MQNLSVVWMTELPGILKFVMTATNGNLNKVYTIFYRNTIE